MALIFDVSSGGEVNLDVSFPEERDEAGDLAFSICTAIGRKLTNDKELEAEILAEVEGMNV
ncbi:hypothetical protein KJ742_01080 [Patescibacteria group bacterium]|nr:hypothetical protein [Patescibacteria group bacterium]